MNENERLALRIAQEAFDAALTDLGFDDLARNDDIHVVEPVLSDLPHAVLLKDGCAPLRFVFGLELDVWVGPYSGVAEMTVSDSARRELQDLLSRVLRSEVLMKSGRRSIQLKLRIPGHKPWLRLRVFGPGPEHALDPFYRAYAE